MVLLEKKVLAVFILTISLLGVVFIGSGIYLQKIETEAQYWVEHTMMIIEQTRGSLGAMVDAETGERGFLITGDPAFLQPLEAARDDVPRFLSKLKDLTKDNAEQQRLLGRAETLYGMKLNIIEEVVETMRRSGFSSSRDIIVQRQGKQVMDDLRQTMLALIASEETLLQARKEKAARMVAITTEATSLLLAVLISAFALIIVRLMKQDERMAKMEALTRQAQKMEAIGQLTGGLAHDFNNSLQVILMNLDLAIRKIGDNNAASAHLQNAVFATEQSARMTSQLLAYARRQPLRPQAVDIQLLVREMASFLRRTLGEDVEIECSATAGCWRALIDPHLLQNTILNLAFNARDAMEGGGRLTIEVANATLDRDYASQHQEVSPGQYVMIAISDTGTGMPPHVIDRAFEPFFTTKGPGKGTGLGLSMVYGFVKQSSGHIKIYSEEGMGTTVKLYLPRASVDAVSKTSGTGASSTRGSGQTILVVEDDDGVRAGVVAQLTDLGYKVLSAETGAVALEILARGDHVDLLFMDVILPGGMNGRKAADEARRLRPGLHVVYTSGYTENAIIHHGRLDEGVTLLSKPYRSVDLAEVVQKALDGGGAAPQAKLA